MCERCDESRKTFSKLFNHVKKKFGKLNKTIFSSLFAGRAIDNSWSDDLKNQLRFFKTLMSTIDKDGVAPARCALCHEEDAMCDKSRPCRRCRRLQVPCEPQRRQNKSSNEVMPLPKPTRMAGLGLNSLRFENTNGVAADANDGIKQAIRPWPSSTSAGSFPTPATASITATTANGPTSAATTTRTPPSSHLAIPARGAGAATMLVAAAAAGFQGLATVSAAGGRSHGQQQQQQQRPQHQRSSLRSSGKGGPDQYQHASPLTAHPMRQMPTTSQMQTAQALIAHALGQQQRGQPTAAGRGSGRRGGTRARREGTHGRGVAAMATPAHMIHQASLRAVGAAPSPKAVLVKSEPNTAKAINRRAPGAAAGAPSAAIFTKLMEMHNSNNSGHPKPPPSRQAKASSRGAKRAGRGAPTSGGVPSTSAGGGGISRLPMLFLGDIRNPEVVGLAEMRDAKARFDTLNAEMDKMHTFYKSQQNTDAGGGKQSTACPGHHCNARLSMSHGIKYFKTIWCRHFLNNCRYFEEKYGDLLYSIRTAKQKKRAMTKRPRDRAVKSEKLQSPSATNTASSSTGVGNKTKSPRIGLAGDFKRIFPQNNERRLSVMKAYTGVDLQIQFPQHTCDLIKKKFQHKTALRLMKTEGMERSRAEAAAKCVLDMVQGEKLHSEISLFGQNAEESAVTGREEVMFFFANRMWSWSLPSSFLTAVKLFFQSRNVLQILESNDVHLPAILKVYDQDHEELLFTENINFVAKTQERELLQREALTTRTAALVKSVSKSHPPGGGGVTTISGIAQVNVHISNQDLGVRSDS